MKKELSDDQKLKLFDAIRKNDVEELRKKFPDLKEYSLDFFSNSKVNEESGYMSLTPLMEAIKSTSPKMVEFLIEMGADVNYPKVDETPLLFLVLEEDSVSYQEEIELKKRIEQSEARTKIAEILIEAGADAGAYLLEKNEDGKEEKKYVLDYVDLESNLLSIIVKGLIKQKKPVTPDLPKLTPLHFAANLRHLGLYHDLLEQGEDQNQRDELGNTSLMRVAEQGCQDMVALALSKDKDVKLLNEQNKAGETAAILAAKNKHFHICLLLASNGADLSIRDRSGKSTIDYLPEEEITALKSKDYKTFKDQEELFQKIADHLTNEKSSDHDAISLKLISKLDPVNVNNISKTYNQYLLELAPTISDLRLLLERGASPHITSSYGNSFIFINKLLGKMDWVNELAKHGDNLQTYKEMQIFNQQVDMIISSGHIMGLDKAIKFPRPDTKESVSIETNGLHSYEAIKLLIECLNEYLQTEDFSSKQDIKRMFEKIVLAYQNIYRYKTDYDVKKAVELIQNHQSDQENVLVFPTAWHKHGITIAFYKDKMILSNRGEGMGESGTLIYTLKNKKDINLDFLEKCFSGGKIQEKDVMLKHIMSVVDDSIKPIPLESKTQKHGTCAFVNAKSAVQGLLYLMEQENILKKGVHKETKSLDDQARNSARKHYKKFTESMRNNQITKLLQTYKKTPPEYRDPYIKLIKQIIELHHGQMVDHSTRDRTPKIDQEYFRLSKIFSELFREKEFDEYVKLFYSYFYNQHKAIRSSKTQKLLSKLAIILNDKDKISEILKTFNRLDPPIDFALIHSYSKKEDEREKTTKNKLLCECLEPYLKKPSEIIFSSLQPKERQPLAPAPATPASPKSTEGGPNKP